MTDYTKELDGDGEAAKPRVFLSAGGDKRAGAGKPWIYSNEIRMDAEAKAIPPGGQVSFHRVDGKPLGAGSFNPHALIAGRLFSDDANAVVDGDFIAGRLRAALQLRQAFFTEPFYRLVHGEADGLPGFIIDRFGDAAVCHLNTAGADLLRTPLLAALDEVIGPKTVIVAGDARARAREGLDAVRDIAKGGIDGPAEISEGGVKFLADLDGGQKTGWYYDQRGNRAFAAALARGRRVLDLYCYGGGFGIAAAAAGAIQVTGIDTSAPALALAAEAARLNGVEGVCDWRKAEVFDAIGALASKNRTYGLVVCDPPAFVKSRKDLAAGKRGYRKLARLAAALVEPGGYLLAASCSYHVGAEEFAAEVARGIRMAGRGARIIHSGGAGPDHPIHPQLPESAYLKSLVLRLD